MKEHFSNAQLRVAYTAPSTIGNNFPFKDKIEDPLLQSGVVYHIKCKDCNNDYIGNTMRTLSCRIKEHQSTAASNVSHVRKHEVDTKHEMDFDNVKILDKADTLQKLDWKEMMYIRELNPTLNIQNESDLFTLVIGNIQKSTDRTRSFEKYSGKNKIVVNKITANKILKTNS